jgi:CheY-like chemotaxis protein
MSSSHPVLVVEDDVDVREAMVQVLQSAGHAAVSAGDGEEALAQLDGGLTPCLILLDLMMPRMDGWEFIEQHHRRARRAPIVVVSAYGSQEQALGGAGVIAYMRKPVDIDELLAVVDQHCPRQ